MTDKEFNALFGGIVVGILFMSVTMLVVDLLLKVPY